MITEVVAENANQISFLAVITYIYIARECIHVYIYIVTFVRFTLLLLFLILFFINCETSEKESMKTFTLICFVCGLLVYLNFMVLFSMVF
jgi:hypothetical protein